MTTAATRLARVSGRLASTTPRTCSLRREGVERLEGGQEAWVGLERCPEVVGQLDDPLGVVQLDGGRDRIPDLHPQLGPSRLGQTDEVLATHPRQPQPSRTVADGDPDGGPFAAPELGHLGVGELQRRGRSDGVQHRGDRQGHAAMVHRHASVAQPGSATGQNHPVARRTPPPVDDDFIEKIVDIDVSSEMQTSFLEYAYSVIYSRALPDARDGLKPVQRRILYSMQEMGVRPDRGHVKCARVVGEVMGKYHPHGDGAIYDALVRTAQPWTMRLTLVDGHGNFGSPDAGPAAMRYTECRMAPAALSMTDGLDSDTVDFKPNYDGKDTEPTVLPAAFPNLLVNGAAGIAVGMATNCAPHNLVEVVQALRHLIKHPNADAGRR